MTSDEWVVEPSGGRRDLTRADLEPLELGAVSVSHDDAATRVLLSGEIDLSLAAELAECSRVALESGRPIRVDVSAVTFIDSTAIGYIVTLASAERDAGRTLRVVGADRRTTDTFELTGISDLVEFEPVFG